LLPELELWLELPVQVEPWLLEPLLKVCVEPPEPLLKV
jgi:hypothetical protein